MRENWLWGVKNTNVDADVYFYDDFYAYWNGKHESYPPESVYNSIEKVKASTTIEGKEKIGK